MPLRRATPYQFKAKGVADILDGSDGFAGSMRSLANLVPAPSTEGVWVCRPAAVIAADFTAAFTSPTGITAVTLLGSRAYGFVSTGRFAGKDEPFCYDFNAAAFIPISNVTAASCPATQATTGDIQPAHVEPITAVRQVFTHPGFAATSAFFGLLDMSSFSLAQTGGTTSGANTVTFASNVRNVGWRVGQSISGAGIPAGTYISAINSAGTTVTMTANATATAGSVSLTAAGGTPAAPLWYAGNTDQAPLPSVPNWCGQFNGRAYFACDNTLPYSDALDPGVRTNASQSLTLGNDQAITCIAGVPLLSTVTGGIIQSLTVFKGADSVYQITGDQAASNLSQNAVNGAPGTQAPNTVCGTPKGLAYVAVDGLRIITYTGEVSDPIGTDGQGVSVPFIYALNPSRMCAAYNQSTIRIGVHNGYQADTPYQEWCFDMKKERWFGPHTFAPALIAAYHTKTENAFMSVPVSASKVGLWKSSIYPTLASVYTEDSKAMTWSWTTSLLPDKGDGSESALAEATFALSLTGTATYQLVPRKEDSTTLDTVFITAAASAAAPAGMWGSFNWGAGSWGSSNIYIQQYRVPWNLPVVFKQLYFDLAGASGPNVAIGTIYAKIQTLGYMLQ